METRICQLLLATILLTNADSVRADCDAPDLNLDTIEGWVKGYSVTIVPPDFDTTVLENDNIAIVDFGDYSYFVINETGSGVPDELYEDLEAHGEFVRSKLITGANYLGADEQSFELVALRAFDLDSNDVADLVFFSVSDGANVYNGIIGAPDNIWVTLIDPECY